MSARSVSCLFRRGAVAPLLAGQVGLALCGTAAADTLTVTERAVTATSSWETMPRLGNDGLSDLVVFTRSDMLPDGNMAKGDIWYQRLLDGVPVGAPVRVTSDALDNQLNDVSGDRIVYTAYDTSSSMSGHIVAYSISTTVRHTIGSALVIQEPRVSGTKVAWREGFAGSQQVMLYDLSWLGTTREPDLIGGPAPRRMTSTSATGSSSGRRVGQTPTTGTWWPTTPTQRRAPT